MHYNIVVALYRNYGMVYRIELRGHQDIVVFRWMVWKNKVQTSKGILAWADKPVLNLPMRNGITERPASTQVYLFCFSEMLSGLMSW